MSTPYGFAAMAILAISPFAHIQAHQGALPQWLVVSCYLVGFAALALHVIDPPR